jgi:sarcosine oxidase subunit beta
LEATVDPARTEIVVGGGGVIGSSIAYHLARRGAKVTLLERGDIPCAASAASAGGVRQQGRDLRELPLAVKSIARWEHLEDELGADLHYRREGHLRVVEDEARVVGEVIPWMEAQRALGLDIRLVTGDDLRELAPGLGPQIAAGTYTPNDGHANPILTTQAFAAAAARHGATLRPHTSVTAIHSQGGRISGVTTTSGEIACDWVVLAAGAWTPGLAQQVDVELPVVPRAPQMIATSAMPLLLHQVVGALGRTLSLKQIPTGNYVIGGGWPGTVHLERGIATPWHRSVVGSLIDSSEIFPVLRKARVERVWVGIEAQCADEVPVLGAIPGIENLTVATGFSGHGFALSPIVGQLLSEQILDGTTSLPIDQLSIERFRGQNLPANWPALRAG